MHCIERVDGVIDSFRSTVGTPMIDAYQIHEAIFFLGPAFRQLPRSQTP